MIKCPECQYIFEYNGSTCPICGAAVTVSAEDIANARREIASPGYSADKDGIIACRHLLADYGDTDSQREYARILEERGGDENMDLAMKYYYLSALGNDPKAAFHYAVLAERTSEIAASFWIRYSAILGYKEGFTRVGDLMMKNGSYELAAYYYSEAAICDDTEAIVTMAKLYYEGKGVTRSEPYAKWYLDKLTIPPIHAIRLAYRLRAVRTQDPPRIEFPNYEKYLRDLAAEARRYRIDTAYYTLTKMLADRNDINAMAALATLLLEGRGCAKNVREAISVTDRCITHGNAAAAVFLAEEYLTGRNIGINVNSAIEYFTYAAKLGYTAAYERIGDIYREGKLVPYDIAKAIELYETAASSNASAQRKANELLRARDTYFKQGAAVLNSARTVTVSEAKEAFRSLAIATAMGSAPAHRLLAKCYANGFGTKQDRQRAFLWYAKAVELGDPESALPLALCYCRGFGTKLSYKKGIPILKLLAESGDKRAEEELFSLYERRTEKAVRSVYSQAMRLIYMKKFAEAKTLLDNVAYMEYPKALYTLGAMHEFGLGTKSDKHKANEYYLAAAKGSSRFAPFTDARAEYKSLLLKLIR